MSLDVLASMAPRKCKVCLVEKPLEHFNLTGDKRWVSRRHECKTCESERKKRWYNENIEREIEKRAAYIKAARSTKTQDERNVLAQKQRDYRSTLKQTVYKAYGAKCKCCGETEPLFLSLDHVNNDGYLLRKIGVDSSAAQTLARAKREGFPSTFQLLCMNCNHGKSRNGGVCPHEAGSTTRA